MNEDDYKVEAEVHMPIKGGYRLKVSIYRLGMYINGWQMYRSTRHKSGWQSKPPYYSVKGKAYFPLEFSHKERLWLEIKAACLKAVRAEEKQQGGNEK